jgi:mycothiol synthase
MRIRPFEVDDYQAISHLHNITYTDFTKDAAELRLSDERNPEHCRWARWVAESNGRVVGFGDYGQNMYGYDPRKFSLFMAVDPGCYGQGIGRSLYDTVVGGIKLFDPLSLDAWSRADMSCLVGFLERRGFVWNTELFTSTLDLSAFDSEHWAPHAARLRAQGLRVMSLDELGVADPEVQHKIYQMWLDIRPDMPIPPGEVRADVPFEHWWDEVNVPSLFPEGFFVALDGERFVGTSQLFRSPAPDELRTGLTGVVGSHRRRGIALGLKVHALTFARRLGYKQTKTENSSENVGMLAINGALGFVRHPAWIRYVKTF